jgi:UDP-glucuronate decarboxylase
VVPAFSVLTFAKDCWRKGANILCVDNFFIGSKRNIEHLLDHKNFEPLRHDVTFPLYVEVDETYNLACPASPIHYQYDPGQTTKTTMHGAINIARSRQTDKSKILQIDIASVWRPRGPSTTEDYWRNVNPIGLRCYDESKRCRGDAVLRLSGSAQALYQSCEDLQHL